MRNNYVFLRGTLKKVMNSSIVPPIDMVEVGFQVLTGASDSDQKHLIMAYSKLAIDVLAANEAKLLPVECLVEGWLQSREDQSWVVAQEVTLHLGRNDRKRLRWEIERLKMDIQTNVSLERL